MKETTTSGQAALGFLVCIYIVLSAAPVVLSDMLSPEWSDVLGLFFPTPSLNAVHIPWLPVRS